MYVKVKILNSNKFFLNLYITEEHNLIVMLLLFKASTLLFIF